MWHEIGHVLMMASTGELEFRFAHSIGDALAAIASDPGSRLIGQSRGYTFPWIFAPRRHDRCVLHGWGWSGSLGRDLRERPDSERMRRKGYVAEQILSSTLFRLYRCLGGDTVLPDKVVQTAARRRASDYVVYLIMQGVQLLGDARAVPANRAEQFAASIADADEGCETCATHSEAWIGGCAHKVVRWAFEAQGMYQEDPWDITEAPGRPPAVDIYIRDDRPAAEVLPVADVAHGPGSYVPVSLDWAGLESSASSSARPAWFAHSDAMKPLQGGKVQVTIGNRGYQNAGATTVTLWHRSWMVNNPAPSWNHGGGGWVEAGSATVNDVAAGATTILEVTMTTSPPPGRYLLLAAADCSSDPSNINDATGLACSRLPSVPLNDLVAADNNLGLIVVDGS